jgi:hypothetical protein
VEEKGVGQWGIGRLESTLTAKVIPDFACSYSTTNVEQMELVKIKIKIA